VTFFLMGYPEGARPHPPYTLHTWSLYLYYGCAIVSLNT